jgi:hypothetical protein
MFETAVSNGSVEFILEEEIFEAGTVDTGVGGDSIYYWFERDKLDLLFGGVSVLLGGLVFKVLIGWEEFLVVFNVWLHLFERVSSCQPLLGHQSVVSTKIQVPHLRAANNQPRSGCR